MVLTRDEVDDLMAGLLTTAGDGLPRDCSVSMSWEVLPECHWYENRATPHRHTGEKPAPYLIRGRYPVPAPLDSVYAEATGSGVVCWHGRGRSRPRSPYRGTGQAPRGSGRHSAVTGCYFRTNDNKVRRLPCLIESEQLRYRDAPCVLRPVTPQCLG